MSNMHQLPFGVTPRAILIGAILVIWNAYWLAYAAVNTATIPVKLRLTLFQCHFYIVYTNCMQFSHKTVFSTQCANYTRNTSYLYYGRDGFDNWWSYNDDFLNWNLGPSLLIC